MKTISEYIANIIPNGRIRIHSWSWVAISGILVLLQLFFPNRAWMTLLIMVGGTWLVTFLWTLSLSRGLSISREVRYGWAQVGDVLQERYTLTNNSILPATWVEVYDHSTIPEYQSGRVTRINGGNVLNWKTEGVCTQRGLYMLGPTSVRSGDPLGLCSVEIQQPNSSILLILPPVLSLPRIDIAPGGYVGDGRLQRNTALETTVSVETIREYVRGDPINTIHWPTSARRNALFIRQFDHMPQADWWVFLDLDQSVQLGTGSNSTEEHGVILAASIVDQGIRQGKRVGFVTHGETLSWLPPKSSRNQHMDIMRLLALVHSGQRPLADLLTEAHHSIRRGASLIVITPNPNTDWLAPLLQLTVHGIAPTVLLLDPASFGDRRSIQKVTRVLTDYNISNTLISPNLFNSPEAVPGRQGKWEWKVFGTGKAVPVRKPDKSNWRPLE